jgi:hypothetical protein
MRAASYLSGAAQPAEARQLRAGPGLRLVRLVVDKERGAKEEQRWWSVGGARGHGAWWSWTRSLHALGTRGPNHIGRGASTRRWTKRLEMDLGAWFIAESLQASCMDQALDKERARSRARSVQGACKERARGGEMHPALDKKRARSGRGCSAARTWSLVSSGQPSGWGCCRQAPGISPGPRFRP